jgi:hypothetical protein
MSAPSRVGPPPGPPPFDWETYPVFRETFLVYFVAPELKEAIRAFGLVFYGLTLQFVKTDPPAWTESPTQAEVRSSAMDLRQMQGFLLVVAREATLGIPMRPKDIDLCRRARLWSTAVGRIAREMELEIGVAPLPPRKEVE